MPGIMADNNIVGQFNAMIHYLTSGTWKDLWKLLDMRVETFRTLGLEDQAPDVVVWQTCQAHGVLLVTGNRNSQRADSLEAAIRTLNEPTSLPVFTISDPDRFTHDRAYAERVADRLMDYLVDFENCLGTGRLYLP